MGVPDVDGTRPPAPLAFDVAARSGEIAHATMRGDRLARFRAELVRRDYGAALPSDPVNIRYAPGPGT